MILYKDSFSENNILITNCKPVFMQDLLITFFQTNTKNIEPLAHHDPHFSTKVLKKTVIIKLYLYKSHCSSPFFRRIQKI